MKTLPSGNPYSRFGEPRQSGQRGRRSFSLMLGLPIGGWLCFFASGLVAGALLLFVPFKPMPFLAVFVMVAAGAGILIVAVYAWLYARPSWLRMAVRARRFARRSRRQGALAQLRARVVHDAWPSSELLGRREEGTQP